MILRIAHFAAVVLVLVGFEPSAQAAPPPSKLAEARIEQAREARAPTVAALRLTVTDDSILEYHGEGRLVSNTEIVLKAGDRSITLGAGDGPGAILGWLLLSSDVVGGLTSRGDFSPGVSAVTVIGEAFAYRYGEKPHIALSRSLDRTLQIGWVEGGVDYVAHFDWEGEGDWPASISVYRAGKPYLRLEIEEEGS